MSLDYPYREADLALHLICTAETELRQVISAAAQRKEDVRLTADIGGVVEMLLKALLAGANPLLVVESPGDRGDLVALATNGPESLNAVRSQRTVGLTEAIKRAGALLGEIRRLAPDLEALAVQRNIATHVRLAPTEPPGLAERMALMLNTYLEVSGPLHRDVDRVFAGYSAAVQQWLSEATNVVAARVQTHVADARERFRERYPSGPHNDLSSRLHELELRNLRARPLTCPACGIEAVLYGTWDASKIEHSLDESGRTGQLDWTPTFTAQAFRCRACELGLEGAAELRAAEVPVVQQPQLSDEEQRDLLAQAAYQRMWQEQVEQGPAWLYPGSRDD